MSIWQAISRISEKFLKAIDNKSTSALDSKDHAAPLSNPATLLAWIFKREKAKH